MTSKVFSIQSSGRFGGLHLETSAVTRVKRGLIGECEVPEYLGAALFEANPTHGKKAQKMNACAVIEDLSIVCVDARAKEVLVLLDPHAKFSRLDSDIGEFFVLFPSSCIDPFDIDGGVEILFDGRVRLRKPRFKPEFDKPPALFSLCSRYEEEGSTMGTIEALAAARKSKITGLSFWDFSERVEIRL